MPCIMPLPYCSANRYCGAVVTILKLIFNSPSNSDQGIHQYAQAMYTSFQAPVLNIVCTLAYRLCICNIGGLCTLNKHKILIQDGVF